MRASRLTSYVTPAAQTSCVAIGASTRAGAGATGGDASWAAPRDRGRIVGAEHVVDAERRESRRAVELDDDSVGGSRDCQPGVHRATQYRCRPPRCPARVRHTGSVEPDRSRKLAALQTDLRRLGRVVVAFSGGADSSLLAAVAHRTLGRDAVHAVTAVSPSLAGLERDDCAALADEWGLRWTPVEAHEMERAAYRANDRDRCFHCKSELMDVLAPIADAESATVVLGVNTDDLNDHRPGQRAATEQGAAFPMVTAGLDKADVRAPVAVAGPAHVGQAGGGVPGESHPDRHARDRRRAVVGRAGRGEVAGPRLPRRPRASLRRDRTSRGRGRRARRGDRPSPAIVEAGHAAGYRYVTLDLEGFRSGNAVR